VIDSDDEVITDDDGRSVCREPL